MATYITLDAHQVAVACAMAIDSIQKERERRKAENNKPRRFWQPAPYHEMAIVLYAANQEDVCVSLLKMATLSEKIGQGELKISREDFDAFESFLED